MVSEDSLISLIKLHKITKLRENMKTEDKKWKTITKNIVPTINSIKIFLSTLLRDINLQSRVINDKNMISAADLVDIKGKSH